MLRYDNEAGKGDHKHIGKREFSYPFESIRKLLQDFDADMKDGSMTTLKVKVQNYEDTIAEVARNAALVAEGKVVEVGSTYTFPTWDMLHRPLFYAGP